MQTAVFLTCHRCEMINENAGKEKKKKRKKLHRDREPLSVFPTILILSNFTHFKTRSHPEPGRPQILQNICCCFLLEKKERKKTGCQCHSDQYKAWFFFLVWGQNTTIVHHWARATERHTHWSSLGLYLHKGQRYRGGGCAKRAIGKGQVRVQTCIGRTN